MALTINHNQNNFVLQLNITCQIIFIYLFQVTLEIDICYTNLLYNRNNTK